MTIFDTIDSVLRFKGRQVWSVDPTATVYAAIEKMSAKGVGALLVMASGMLVGIISERDYAREVILKNRSSKTTEVREIMSCPVIWATSDRTIEECMRMMTKHHIRHLPVVEQNNVVGVISIGDLVNWIINAQEETIVHLQNYIEGRYPA